MSEAVPDVPARYTNRAFLIAATTHDQYRLFRVEDSLNELAQLAGTAGIEVRGRVVQRLARPQPATYIGKGKLSELRLEFDQRCDVNTAIFDDELSPGQQRNIGRALGEGVKVLDRTALILDIFAQHAHSREGQIQVELAQYEYLQPRLAGMWRHLIRQAGGRAGGGAFGVGLRGPGETQLETDRRQIRSRIASLRRELEEVRLNRQQHYRQRQRQELKTVALVGYTNAGKSSLLNALSYPESSNGNGSAGSEPPRAYVVDQLFATLDPTTRKVRLPSGTQVLFTDTVGFIKKLPQNLVAAFRATLEGIEQADLLLHVADINHANVDAQIRAVGAILSELGVADKPTLLVWNKIDVAQPAMFRRSVPGVLRVSALKGTGIDVLLCAVERALQDALVAVDVDIPYTHGRLRSRIFAQGSVQWYRDGQTGTRMRAFVPPGLAAALRSYHSPAERRSS
jgi:GTP-binding protein HflX